MSRITAQSDADIDFEDVQLTDEQERFLEEYSMAGDVVSACRAAGVSPRSIRKWSIDEKTGDAFEARKSLARTIFTESLLGEAIRRGKTGYQEPIVYQGEIQYQRDADGEFILDKNLNKIPATITKHSDSLLVELLRAFHPRFSRPNTDASVEIQLDKAKVSTGGAAAKIQIEFVESDGEGREKQVTEAKDVTVDATSSS